MVRAHNEPSAIAPVPFVVPPVVALSNAEVLRASAADDLVLGFGQELTQRHLVRLRLQNAC